MNSKAMIKSRNGIAFLLAFLMIMLMVPANAGANAGDQVRCKVTSAKAPLYAAIGAEEPLLASFKRGAEFTAYETGNDGWLAVDTIVNGRERRCYISILDVAVTYSNLEGEDAIGSGLAEGGNMPPDVVGETPADGLQLDGVAQKYTARSEKAHIYADPDLDSERLGYYRDGQQFEGVLQEDGVWIKVVVTVDGQETYGYVPLGRITVKSNDGKNSNAVTIRITSGVITVYAKPSKSSEQIGVVSAPVRFEGVKTKSGKWVRVELDGEGRPQYGYIEAKYISRAK